MYDNVIIFYIKLFAFLKNRAILNTEKCSCKSMKQLQKNAYTPGIEIKTPKVYITTQEEYKMELEVLRKDMVAAMKAKDKVTKEAVSSLISAVKKVAIDEGCRDEIKSDLVDRVILKELKTVKEQLDTCPESREDLKAEYQARYDVIAKYAPKQMDAAEVKAYLEEKFADVIATKNKGQIMKAVMADMKGKADGKVINQVVAELCK